MSIFGVPKIIQSDQWSKFCSKLFAEVLKKSNIKQSQSSAYNAQSQGDVERFHQTLKSLLHAYCTGGLIVADVSCQGGVRVKPNRG